MDGEVKKGQMIKATYHHCKAISAPFVHAIINRDVGLEMGQKHYLEKMYAYKMSE